MMMEDGEILENLVENNNMKTPQKQQNKENNGLDDSWVEPPLIEDGFEDVNANQEVFAFGNFNQNTGLGQKNLRDMFKVQQNNRFEAKGGNNQEIHLNQFAIRK